MGINKSVDVWDYIKKFDILGLVETWVEEKQWERLKEKLPNKFKWTCIPAIKEQKIARAKEDIIMAVNKKMDYSEIKACSERVTKIKLRLNEKTWSIFTVYSQNIKEIFNQINK